MLYRFYPLGRLCLEDNNEGDTASGFMVLSGSFDYEWAGQN